jgi:hypothetical protein
VTSIHAVRSYMVRIEGRGIDFLVKDRLASVLGPLGFGRAAHCVGFFTTRYVNSDSEVGATELARKLVTDELLRKKVVTIDRLPQLELRVDEVAVIAEAHKMKPNEGFTFFEK